MKDVYTAEEAKGAWKALDEFRDDIESQILDLEPKDNEKGKKN